MLLFFFSFFWRARYSLIVKKRSIGISHFISNTYPIIHYNKDCLACIRGRMSKGSLLQKKESAHGDGSIMLKVAFGARVPRWFPPFAPQLFSYSG